MAEEEPNETPEPDLGPAIEITNLSSITIQIHELFLELKKSGFKASQALTLVGMVLSSSAAVDFIDYPPEREDDTEGASGQVILFEFDAADATDDEDEEWDKFLENPDPQ
jgi:hypothetical protein